MVWASGSYPLVFRIPQRLILLHDSSEAVAKYFDFDCLAWLGEVGAQHAERDRPADPVAKASRRRLADDLAVMPQRGHVGRVAVPRIFDDQRDEALPHA